MLVKSVVWRTNHFFLGLCQKAPEPRPFPQSAKDCTSDFVRKWSAARAESVCGDLYDL
jgi:hypothetical protein